MSSSSGAQQSVQQGQQAQQQVLHQLHQLQHQQSYQQLPNALSGVPSSTGVAHHHHAEGEEGVFVISSGKEDGTAAGQFAQDR